MTTEQMYSLPGMPPLPVCMVSGQGAFLWDTSGKKYIDFNAGFSSVNQGHCHPRIVEAMIKQCQTLTLPSRAVYNEDYGKLCKRVCELTGFDKAAALNSGAEAVEMAIKVARLWGYKRKGIEQDKALVLTCTSNYHGRTLGPLSASSNEKLKEGCGPFMPNIGPSCAGNIVRFGVIGDLELAFSTCGPQIAAFMLEPVQGNSPVGILPAPSGYLTAVHQLCKKYNILLICDEIQSGLGRAGYLMSYEREEIMPDLAILGKSLSGGVYPVSMVAGRAEVMDVVSAGQYGSTFSGNPLASAVANAALDVLIDEKLIERSQMLSKKLVARFNAIKSPYFERVTGLGMFWSLSIKQIHPQNRVTGGRLAALLLQRGLLTNSFGNVIRIAPALVIEEKVLIRGVDMIEEALNDIAEIEGEIEGDQTIHG
ncbi:putative ornithine aminotransferase [Tricladium varicosporioides]|nr:putative ornithine aminotransferase [Hymenoscyphus varicosporioides]